MVSISPSNEYSGMIFSRIDWFDLLAVPQYHKKGSRGWEGFPGSSAVKESACSAGDPGLIPGSGRSAGEGIDYPLQYSWASLVAQLVKNPSAMQTRVQSLGWEDPLEKGKATHSSILAWRISWTKSRTWLSNFHFHFSPSTHHWRQILLSPFHRLENNLKLNVSKIVKHQ